MLARSLLLAFSTVVALSTTATDAEARRFRLFSSAKATTPAKPDALGAARTSVPATRAATPAAAPAATPPGRSGTFVFFSSGHGTPAAAAPAPTPSEAPGRRYDGSTPMVATFTDAPAPAAPSSPARPAAAPPEAAKPVRPAEGFAIVSGPSRGFEVVTYR